MYNMRNVKSRQLITGINSLNWNNAIENNRRKRPSFCTLVIPEPDTKARIKRNSVNRYHNIEGDQLFDN